MITLKHIDPGRNTSVGQDLTNRRARYLIRTFSPQGRYYTVAKRKVFTARNGATVICLWDRSRRVRL